MAKKKKKNNIIQKAVLNSRKRKRRRKRRSNKMPIILIIIILILLTVFLKRNAIRLKIKGYTKEDRSILLKLDKKDLKEYFTLDEAIDLSKWNAESNNQHYFDYDLYQKQSPKQTVEYIIQQVDTYYELQTELNELGYTKEFCREHYSIYNSNDYKILIENSLDYETTEPFINTYGCQLEDMQQYIDSGKDATDAILSTTYSFIDSANGYVSTYLIKDPTKYDTLIKGGFTLGADYEPNDLVEVNLPLDSEITTAKLRKKAAKALEEMASAASEEGFTIGIRSAYRSYSDQDSVYNTYIAMYGYAYASTLASIPGSSEHQLGLGVDLTSQSVIDGVYGAFSDTEEYIWTSAHAHEYGFILRYPEDKTSLTGSQNEPWHYRYVGKEIAQECYDNNWTLEEYIQHYGFDYSLEKQ